MSMTPTTPSQTLAPRRAWRRVETRLPVVLFERLEKWRRSLRVSPDDPSVLHEIDRNAAIEQLLEAALNRSEQSLDAAAAERLSDDIRGVHAALDAMGREFRDRQAATIKLVECVAPHAVATPALIAHWMAQDPDVRLARETVEQTEDRILDELDATADAIWTARRREAFPEPEDLLPDVSIDELNADAEEEA
jgi:hypothetical protein